MHDFIHIGPAPERCELQIKISSRVNRGENTALAKKRSIIDLVCGKESLDSRGMRQQRHDCKSLGHRQQRLYWSWCGQHFDSSFESTDVPHGFEVCSNTDEGAFGVAARPGQVPHVDPLGSTCRVCASSCHEQHISLEWDFWGTSHCACTWTTFTRQQLRNQLFARVLSVAWVVHDHHNRCWDSHVSESALRGSRGFMKRHRSQSFWGTGSLIVRDWRV